MATIDKVSKLRPVQPSQQVYKDDCVYCFDTAESPHGLDVCLNCYIATSPSPDHNFTRFHQTATGHELYLNIKKSVQTERVKRPKLDKLAIEADTEEDHFETHLSLKDLGSNGEYDESEFNQFPGFKAVVDSVINAVSYAKKEEIQSWELEILPCEHVLTLEQSTTPEKIVKHCADCDLTNNLWLCLVCGRIGCGRQQFGSTIGGNGHGLQHYEATGHGISVKLGSITPDGTADVFCYQCSDEIKDPELVAHMKYLGLNIEEQEKTEKSLVEMQLEQNLKWDFSMTDESGQDLEPIFGSGFTGIKNLGNSCYMSSVLQCLFALSDFGKFNTLEREQTDQPALDLRTQLQKLGDGLLSGRYANPDSAYDSKFQRGISPGMFKALIGKNHEEFSTMRQQDAFEFLTYFLDKLETVDSSVSDIFKFITETRVECKGCKAVRYKKENQENLSFAVPAELENPDEENSEQGGVYKSQSLERCLEIFTGNQETDYKCKTCGNNGSIISTKLATSPKILVLNARRFKLINWVPTKLNIPVEVPGTLDIQAYISKGPQQGENVVEDDHVEDEANQDVQFQANPEAVAQLQSMGFPEVRCEKALYHTGNNDAEAATNWLFSHMDDADIDEPLKLNGSSKDTVKNEDVNQLVEMGFSEEKSRQALKKKGSVEASLEYLFSAGNDDDEDDNDNKQAPSDNLKSYGSATPPENGYRLKAIICHKGGSVHAGHYVAFVRRPVGSEDKWVLYNDEKVVLGGEVEEMKQYAYVYFFERCD